MSGSGRQRCGASAIYCGGGLQPQSLQAATIAWQFISHPRLLPDGWAQNVRVEIADGRFASIERDAPPRASDERVAVALPGMCNVHSHGFQRGMAGLTEYRGPAADNFWSWRTLMYRFVARMTPEDLDAITAQAYVEMLESGFTRVGEFHYVHHDPAGMPYANPAETSARSGGGGRAHGHRPHVAAGVLRAWRLWRRAAERRPASLRHRRGWLCALVRRQPRS